MKKFIFIYVVYIAVVQILLTFEFVQSFSVIFSTVLASTSSFIINIFDDNVIQQGAVLTHRNGTTALMVDKACNAIELLLLLYGAILAFPATLKHKLVGLASCLVGVQLLNIVRIISLFYTIEFLPGWFDWTHEYFWRFVITLDVMICFSLWIMYTNSHKKNILTAA